jgi:hypothetical protein
MTQMKDLTKHDLEKALALKIKENTHLKAQNARLIEHLQDQVDVSSTHAVQNESIHNKIAQIGGILNEINRQEQERKLNVDRIFQKILDFETQFALSQKQSSTPTLEDIQQLKMDVIRIHSRETSIENHLQTLNTQMANTNRAFSLLLHKLLQSEVRQPSNAENVNLQSNIRFQDDELFKIAEEFKAELKGNDEDYQMIFRLLTEKNGTSQTKHEST